MQAERKIEICAQEEETCRDAVVWMERVAYPCVSILPRWYFACSAQTFQFFISLGTEVEGRFLPISAN